MNRKKRRSRGEHPSPRAMLLLLRFFFFCVPSVFQLQKFISKLAEAFQKLSKTQLRVERFIPDSDRQFGRAKLATLHWKFDPLQRPELGDYQPDWLRMRINQFHAEGIIKDINNPPSRHPVRSSSTPVNGTNCQRGKQSGRN